jgi:6-phosphogluconolactonase
LFDVVLLGIGNDGHTASLFPGQPALDETQRWVVAVRGARAEARVTLTFPALDSARDLVFLAVGANKRDVVQRAQAGDRALPSARIKSLGTLRWFVDRAAAS